MPYPKKYVIYSDLEEMLKLKIDLVFVATPHASYFECAKMILAGGIDCLIEKPIVNITG